MTNELHLIDPMDPETFMKNPYAPYFEKVDYDEATSSDGSARIMKFNVPNNHSTMMYNLDLIESSGLIRVCPPGDYTKLGVDGVLMMSDTPAESWDHLEAVSRAEGHVLVNGLGLGFYLAAIQRNDAVDKITVVEKSAGVIELIGPHFPDVNIIHGDALTVKHDEEFDFAWHDIWPKIDPINMADMIILEDNYGGKSWCRPLLEQKIEEGYF
tara:strand:- start:5113 stop:5748 length:636 start_codon:yes stop_codon:yes gene_type:complete